MIIVIHTWTSVWIIYTSQPRQQRNMVIGAAMYILVPDYPTIHYTTTDLKMGPSNIYRCSWEFLHWLRFQFNLSHYQLVKMNSLSPESKMTKTPTALPKLHPSPDFIWFSSEKMQHLFDEKRRCTLHIWSAVFEKKIKTTVPQKRSSEQMKIQNYRSIKCPTVRVSNQIHVDGMAATLTIWKYKNNLQMLARRSTVFKT